MTFIFEVSKDGSKEEVAIVANTRAEAESEIRAWGIMFLGGAAFTLKEILGLNNVGMKYLS